MQNKRLTIYQGAAERVLTFSGEPTLSELLRQNGVVFSEPCGGCGRCGGCAVKITGDVLPPDESELAVLDARSLHGMRLACRTRLAGSACVTLPDSAAHAEALRSASASETVLGAVDIGTTTVCVSILSASDGSVLSRASALNAQRLYGADVMTRISACAGGSLEAMHIAVIQQINSLLRLACDICGADLSKLSRLAVAGNTVMQHIAAGLSPEPVGTAPYEPEEHFGRVLSPSETGLPADAFFLPCTGGFTGGDLTACLAAYELPENALLCDLGTNGEIALCSAGRYFVTSAAAGPALEGGGIGCGSGAVEGAVSRLYEQNGALCAEVIGGGEPATLCGGAIISAAAWLLDSGIVEPSGRMQPERISLVGSTYLTAHDIRELQLAKGAIAAAMLRLADAAGILPSDISRVIFTGGFGCFTNAAHARRIGLLPPQLCCPVDFMPAMALEGAQSCLSEDGSASAIRAAGRCIPVNLGGDPDFDELFIDNIPFPET